MFIGVFDGFIEIIKDWLLGVFGDPRVVVVLIAILPIVEARLAIPIAVGYGLGYVESWAWSFIGSSLIVPLLLLVLIPFIRWLTKTRLFRKAGTVILQKFEKKAAGVESEGKQKSSDWKKMLGVFVFVAIPLPLTGVWTGSAVASIVKLKYPKAVAAVIAGNLVASGIIAVLSAFFSDYINYIILGFTIIAIVVVVALIVKIALHKTEAPDETSDVNEKE